MITKCPAVLATPLLLASLAAPGQAPAPAAPAPATPAPATSAEGATTPRDPKSPIPGVADGRGPTGPVSLKILSPAPGEELPLPGAVAKGAPVEVKIELRNYETFYDPTTKTGQAVAIFLDGLPYFAHYDPTKPWVFRKVAPGTHTLRAVPIRPWGDPIREDGAFAMVTFRIGPKSEKNAPATGEPVLTVFEPKQRKKYSAAEAASMRFEFLVRGCRVSDGSEADACRVRYRIDDRHEEILTKPDGVPIEGLAVGKHVFIAGLTRDGKLIPGAYTLVQGSFRRDGDSALVRLVFSGCRERCFLPSVSVVPSSLSREAMGPSAGVRGYRPSVFLVAALFVPICVVGIGEPERARGPEEFALVSPGAQPEAPAETDTASAPLGFLFPAGLPSAAVVVPEPTWTRLAAGDVELLTGLAYRSSLAPPPRRT